MPDLVAFVRRRGRRPALGPADILLVAEVVSPSRQRVDHEHKRRVYASGGIAHCWIVDRDPIRVSALRLAGRDSTEVVQAHWRGAVHRDPNPFPLTFRFADLLV